MFNKDVDKLEKLVTAFSAKQIMQIQYWINNYLRKISNGLSANIMSWAEDIAIYTGTQNLDIILTKKNINARIINEL